MPSNTEAPTKRFVLAVFGACDSHMGLLFRDQVEDVSCVHGSLQWSLNEQLTRESFAYKLAHVGKP